MLRLTKWMLLALAAPAVVGTATAMACSCTGFATDRELKAGFREADAAAIARLVKIEPGERRRDADVFVMRLERVYKGHGLRRQKRVRVRDSLASASCGMPRGKKSRGWFLYRSDRRDRFGFGGRPGTWSSSLCSNTTPERIRRAARLTREDGSAASGAPAFPGCESRGRPPTGPAT